MANRAFVSALFVMLTASGSTNTTLAAPMQNIVALSAPLSPSGGTVVFPSIGGYGGTFVYSSNNAVPGASASISTISAPSASLVPAPPPSGTMLVAFELTLNQSVTFTSWYRMLTTITVPASVATSGHPFSEYGYDLTSQVGEGSNPGTLNGATITFAPGFGPVTLLANHTYLIVLAME